MPPDVLPKLTTLSPDQIQYIHERSLEILGRAGVRVDSPRARHILADSQGIRWVGEDRALFDPALVEWAIQAAPAAVDLFDRRGQLVFRLGEGNSRQGEGSSRQGEGSSRQGEGSSRQGEGRTRFGIGVTNLYYQDPLSDAIEP